MGSKRKLAQKYRCVPNKTAPKIGKINRHIYLFFPSKQYQSSLDPTPRMKQLSEEHLRFRDQCFFLNSNGSVRELTGNNETCDLPNNLASNRFRQRFAPDDF